MLSPRSPFACWQTDNEIIVSDYSQMDRVLKEERKYILDMCKAIKAAGCNVLLIQKSILRDAVNDLALHFLAKMKIVVVRDVERDDVEFICKVRGLARLRGVATAWRGCYPLLCPSFIDVTLLPCCSRLAASLLRTWMTLRPRCWAMPNW
jgi:hypothetical protein